MTIPTEATPTFEPIFGKVVIKIDKTPERKYGQLYLPQRERDRSTIGKVHAVYPPMQDGDEIIEAQVAVGDTVIFGQYTGTAIEIGKDLFIICKEHDLLSIVKFDGESIPPIEEAL